MILSKRNVIEECFDRVSRENGLSTHGVVGHFDARDRHTPDGASEGFSSDVDVAVLYHDRGSAEGTVCLKVRFNRQAKDGSIFWIDGHLSVISG
jgi:hypothetical protein